MPVPATPTRQTIAAVAVFVALSVVHLGALIGGLQPLADGTKPFLMPMLAVAVLCADVLRFGRRAWLLLAALALSCVGDVALLSNSSTAFVIGLSSFLLAHLAYIVIFAGATGAGRPRFWGLVYVAWLVALLLVLVPHLDALLVPVIGYGFVIAGMAIAATRCAPKVTVGATLFLLSDSLLAINRFVPDANLWQPGFLIMLTYIAGQALIAWGLVESWRAHASQLPTRNSGKVSP
ncbi:hypothetical protein DF223_01315 [Mycetocola zhujimingii]|uniref:Lysoplasmalogenase n=1 Tax=Mycetocola zhujimingii TaxID=2079792 RepID=A0A2U1TGK8_9MICO|nr:hypothetical protein DF223_01315 [Mycetocola zhujimingii]